MPHPLVQDLSLKRNTSILIVTFLLGLLTVACYWPVTANGFVGLDDPTYLCQNPHLQQGLTWAAFKWAFVTGHASNWHPLTWLSHMLDCQIYGMQPGGHHFTSLLLHAINALLVCSLLKRMTGAFWRSALVAALFAWHPTHVESVAWAAERKDVLSTFFFLLTLWAYARYAEELRSSRATVQSQESQDQRPERSTQSQLGQPLRESAIKNQKSKIKNSLALAYSLALVFFALGLMSKPMLVTLPFVLLLLDFWPLRRFVPQSMQEFSNPPIHQPINPLLGHSITPPLHLIREKLPFFALSVAASLVTYFVQKAGGAVSSLTTIPLGARIANALVAYVRYLSKTVWPVDLSVFYPLPDHWPVLTVVASGLVLLGLSWLVIRRSSRYPYLGVGWFWFLGTLVPTIGLVQVGSQSMADRYLYIPSMGLFVMAAWGIYDLQCRRRRKESQTTSISMGLPIDQRLLTSSPAMLGAMANRVLPAAATAILMACLACTSFQIGYWHDEETLFRHAMQVTSDNYLAYDHLAKVCENAGRKEEAFAYYTELLRLKPGYPEGQYNLGTLLMGVGKLEAAAPHLQAAVVLRPQWAQAHSNLGLTFFRQNKPDEALNHLEIAAQLAPQDPDPQINLGVTLLAMNRAREAANAFSKAVRLAPDVPETQFLLALALSHQRKPAEALLQAEKARDLALANGRQEVALKATELVRVCQAENPLPKTR
jgi:Flp pilus assembly protein TadD